MSNREDKLSKRTQDALDALEGRLQIRNIGQREVTKHAVKGCIVKGSERVSVISQVDDAQRFSLFSMSSKLEHFRGQVYSHYLCSSLHQQAREHTLAAGKVTDALPANITEQVEDGWKIEVMHEHVCPDALVIPVCNLIVAGLGHKLLLQMAGLCSRLGGCALFFPHSTIKLTTNFWFPVPAFPALVVSSCKRCNRNGNSF